ncbi:DUF3325 domain-containing protein [Cupriavidus respiraculi]|uniref:DUF3325 domain-containing protein n=1 Tax=Cupriavidus respiraculi TaxID=195930 RepID=UPI001C93AB0A|nr:DUF3325 domain-containing protein [Cupriavidus respiraculi]MBY4947437.1 DUF3325 domain-containing protein [Cupriavidus respiraculi]
MSAMLAFVASLALAFSGLGALSMTLDRHYAQVHGRGAEPPPALLPYLHGLGWLALGLALASHVGAEGWAMGTLYWVGTLTVSGVALVLLLSYAPRTAPRLAPWAAAVGLGSFALQLAN